MIKSNAVGEPRVRQHPEAINGLVRRAGDGDDRAWNRLVDEFTELVWSVTRSHRLSDADAADVAQTTWLRLVEHMDRLHEPSRLGPWLATTARRESLRTLRRAASVVPSGDELPQQIDDRAEPEVAQLVHERDDALRSAFSHLAERDQAVLRLTLADPPLSYQEIGTALEMPVGSIGPTRMRALDRLRREVELLYPLATGVARAG